MMTRFLCGVVWLQVSLSSEVMAMVKMVPRGLTTCIDAYLTPVINTCTLP
jgi:N-methylhydantoinase A/oxoprolinase/acetone carboxylase beta subunit